MNEYSAEENRSSGVVSDQSHVGGLLTCCRRSSAALYYSTVWVSSQQRRSLPRSGQTFFLLGAPNFIAGNLKSG